jgi:hypothetical protein
VQQLAIVAGPPQVPDHFFDPAEELLPTIDGQ